MTLSLPTHQKGSTLFVALIMLLVITLLALSGTREVVLESRITGNFIEQQKLLNDAEATLREGEKLLALGNKPVEPNCAEGTSYCLRNEEPSYAQDFNMGARTYAFVTGDSSANEWYAVPAPSGATEGQAENPEYGNMMLGIGTFRYEINAVSESTITGHKANLRTTTAKVFN
ncbi:pilus assembly protein PilX [Pseudomonas sp. o96-267]|uniref:pilus assembly PilX family protein n=1 Tax=Pseudomonas sp. o96-267 TaxID=2479853 RepID=UPI000F78EB25|nr:PilX N-terminal domain-containing pilus assembly protein [Pseudomonas sp. o96-267]RRV32852.1 pilus assembly protein PilX [Pseudomonas sp. o96-267]